MSSFRFPPKQKQSIYFKMLSIPLLIYSQFTSTKAIFMLSLFMINHHLKWARIRPTPPRGWVQTSDVPHIRLVGHPAIF